MSKRFFSLLLIGFLPAFLSLRAWGQMTGGDFAQQETAAPPQEEEEDKAPERKHPSVFHRPARETPADQLAYADALLAEGRVKKAARQYRALVHKWHHADEAPRAQLAYAQLLEKRGKHEKAFEEYQYLVDFYVGLFPFDDVLDRQFRLANAVAAERHLTFFVFRGVEAPELAIPLFEKILRNAPQWPRTPEIQQRIAVLHEDAGEDEEAVRAYALVLELYPDSPMAGDASYRRALCLCRLADDSPNNERALRDAVGACDSHLTEYPSHAGTAEITAQRDRHERALAAMFYERAWYYDHRARRPAAALIAYEDFLRQFPLAAQAEDAEKRAAELRKEKENHAKEP